MRIDLLLYRVVITFMNSHSVLLEFSKDKYQNSLFYFSLLFFFSIYFLFLNLRLGSCVTSQVTITNCDAVMVTSLHAHMILLQTSFSLYLHNQ